MADVELRPAGPGDARVLAGLHRSALPESFLAALGSDFLAVLYRRLVQDERSAVLVALSGAQEVVGFVAGTEDTRQFYVRFLWRDALAAGLASWPRLVGQLPRVLETWSYSRWSPEDAPVLPAAELLSLAVAGPARGRGVGGLLVRSLQAEMRRRLVPGLRVVVAAENGAAIRVYRDCGFEPAARTQVHAGRTSEVLVWLSR